MSNIYLYKNKMWKELYKFTYTGSVEPFTLPTGEYLCICKGAKGGLYQTQSPHQNLGGTSYGILHPNAPVNLYAVVGGDGGNGGGDGSWGIKYGHGGFNGGGSGGKGARCNNFRGGAGGGGASDIRLSGLPLMTEMVKTIDYSGNERELTYIESDGTQWLNTEFVPSQLTRIEVVCEILTNTTATYSALFGARYSSNNHTFVLYSKWTKNDTGIGSGYGNRETGVTSKKLPKNQKIKIVYDNGVISWYDMEGTLIDSFENSTTPNGVDYPMYIFNVNERNNTKGSGSNIVPYYDYYASARIYNIKMYEDDELVHWYVPWTNHNPEIETRTLFDAGLYDLVTNKTIRNMDAAQNQNVHPFGLGEYVDIGFRTEYHYWVPNEEALNSRIMVAGGGGGGQGVPVNDVRDFTGFGGGVYGGYPSTYPSSYSSSQTSGYKFGIGRTAPNKVTERNYKDYSAEGLSGGGGGWYGGQSSTDTSINTAINTMDNGGGGSGYVLTELSYKPEGYLDGYDYSDLYFSDVFMSAGSADEACVIICQRTSQYNTGDTIICDCVGEGERFVLVKGNYTVTCYGGDGGVRNYAASSGRGGYATGTFTNAKNQAAFVYVGGSTFPATMGPDVYVTFPTMGFNGGGAIGGLGSDALIGTGGGGGTDLRIGEDSLYSRLIVAGGAGGQGASNTVGGAGGGTSGGASVGRFGDNGGPGTQTEPGISTTYPEISGGFGYGGNGICRESGFGGSGGGGWYGGSGTRADGGGDDDRSGSGGSGYVFINGASVPEHYKLDSSYYMTGTTLTQGGNDLPRGVTKAIIHVNSIANVLFIAEDANGYKYFDGDINEWKPIEVNSLTPEVFEQYGVYVYSSDTGLDNEYSIIAYDPDNIINTMNMYVVPPLLTIETTYYTRRAISKYVVDMDIDPETTTFTVDEVHKGTGDTSRVEFTMKCNMTDVPDEDFRLYCIYGYTTQGGAVYHEPVPPKPPVKPNQYLLHVGIGTTFPSRYKTYMNGYIGSTAITSVNTAVSCESHRNVYSCALCNDTLYRITKLNLISNISTQIKDISKSNLGSYPPGDIRVDDKYIYMVSALNDGDRVLRRIPLDPNDPTISSYTHGSDDNGNFNAVGKMEWLDDTHLMILYHQGFTVFDTYELTFTDMGSNGVLNTACRDMAVGKKHAIAIPTGSTNNFYICELATNTWSRLSDTGQSLKSSQTTACCYGDGFFYITQQNYIYIMDDETLEVVKVIATPYTNTTPKLIMYSNHNLFVLMQNNHIAYIYDIQGDKFGATNIPFTIDDWVAAEWIRGCAYRGFMFIPNMKLFTINFTEYAKYDLGYVDDQFMMVTNSANIEHQTYTYDERFVTFTKDNMWIHPGYISKHLDSYDTDMKYTVFNKNEYNKYLNLDTSYEEEPIPPEPEPI